MTKLMNLYNHFAVSNCTASEDPLSGCTLESIAVECMQCFVNFPVSNSYQERTKCTKWQGSNPGICGYCGNIGLPKARKGHGNGNIVKGIMLGNSSRLSLSTGGGIKTMGNLRFYATFSVGRSLELPKGVSFKPGVGSPLIIDKSERFVTFAPLDAGKLIHAIAHPDLLWLAYELIKSKPGNMTRGVSTETLDGLSRVWIDKTSSELRAGKYRFGLARRIMIPKVGKPGERPLTMASFREKVVQKAIQMVLQELFEPRFLNTSHGFRPGRGCHTALQMVDQHFRGGKWVIEADITKCFDTIPHDKLLAVLRRHITCSKTLALIHSGLKAGYVVLGKASQEQMVGTPQGSILSPLLNNIFLHLLDQFMERLSAKHTLGKTRRKNPEYRKLQSELSKNKGDADAMSKLRRRKLPRSGRIWLMQSKDQMDPGFRRLAYVRYADHFLICVTGPHQLAVDVMEQVRTFLDKELGLELNQSKTLITKFSDGINFLGGIITNRTVSEKPIKLMAAGPAKGHLVRVSPRLSFHAPIAKLIDRLQLRGYYRWSETLNRAVPTALRSLVNLDHRTILLLYNSVIRGILNYYSFADNRKSLGSIIHGLKWSCALTLALKYKLRTAAKAYKAFGRRLACADSGVELYIPDTFARLPHLEKFKSGGVITPEQAIKLSYSNRFTLSPLGKPSVICGNPVVQMHQHQMRKLRELRSRLHLDWFTMQMAAINRKQVPLCADHHHRLHSNSLSATEHELFRLGCEAVVAEVAK
uniref:Putative reverse transcriptase and intron maturase n=1 Tax=Chlorokybus atmophyticus TaxID=3144 RepID=A6YEC9_CHLAT|nr:putative reverse transcriptase and intron maturase [Chlorokybus atmophyticus]ABO15142.1 putative reverse transcriptase and intron maturase [Chlorokybus atmophyticus]